MSGLRIMKVQGVRYRVVNKPAIKEHLFRALREEWEEDEFNEEWYPQMSNWEWTVQTLKISDVKLWEPLMKDPVFIRDLKRRTQEQIDMILRNEAIEPVVVRRKDMVIYDGYARLHALKKLGKDETLAYIGK